MKHLLSLKLGIVTTVFLMSVMACQKNEPSPNHDLNTNNSKSKKYSKINKSNYDFSIYGSSHNDAMDYVANHPNFENLSKLQIFNYLGTYSDNNFASTGDIAYPDHLSSLSYTDILFSDISNAGQKLYNDGLIEYNMISLAQSFFDVFDNAVPQSGTPHISVSAFTTNMNVFESNLRANYNVEYNPTLKEGNFPAKLLAAASVAKSSYAYWENVANEPTNPWYDKQNDRNEDDGSGFLLGGWFGRAWHSVKTAAVDVGGFFGGGGQWSGCDGICFNFGVAWQHAGSQSAAY